MACHRGAPFNEALQFREALEGDRDCVLDAYDLERMNDFVADVLRHEFLLLRPNLADYVGASLMRSVYALSNIRLSLKLHSLHQTNRYVR